MDIFGSIMNFVYIPFGLIFKLLYLLVKNYGLAIILFAVISKIAMLPLGIKNEKSRRKMQAVQPQIQELQKKYKNDTQNPKYAEEMQAIYSKAGTSMYGGCGWQFLQLPIIWAIWNAIRNPITYIWDVTAGSTLVSDICVRLFNAGAIDLTLSNGQTVATAINSYLATHQISLAAAVNANQNLVADLLPSGYSPINFTFLGLDLGALPSWTSWTLLVPILSGLTSFMVGFISQKMMGGAAQKNMDGPTKRSTNTLLYVMPIISVIIGFTFDIAIGLYWILSNILSIAQTYFVFKYCAVQERKNAPAPTKKEKKLNYNQIQKMEREQRDSDQK